MQGSPVKHFINGLLWSCCRLTLPLGGGIYGGNIRRLIIPILTQMLDWGVRVAGCCRRKRRWRGKSSSSACPVLVSRITCRGGQETEGCLITRTALKISSLSIHVPTAHQGLIGVRLRPSFSPCALV